MPTVKREDFLRCLESVRPGLSTREILEQSHCFIFQDGNVTTFNGQIACRAPSLLDKSVEGAVQAKPLLDVLGKIPDEELDIGMTEGGLVLKGKRKKVVMSLEAQISLDTSLIEEPETWVELPPTFGEAVHLVQECASNDSTKQEHYLNIHPKWLEATDQIQVCRWRIRTGITTPTQVRKDDIKHITQLGMSEFSETQSWLHFRNPSGLILSCLKFVDEYLTPDISEVLKVTGTPTSLPKTLAEAAERAEIFSKENQDNNLVQVEMNKGKLRIKGQGNAGYYLESKTVQYDGPSLKFLIAPSLLKELTKRHNECQVTQERLIVEGPRWKYVACLGSVEDVESNGSEERSNKRVKQAQED